MRAALLAAGLLMAGSCGGSPSPTGATPIPVARAVTLDNGPYTLVITLSTTGRATCQNGVCTFLSLCVGSPSQTTASFAVAVERSGDTAIVRAPGGASAPVLSLTLGPASVTGTISGSGRDAQGMMVDTAGTVTGAAPSDLAYVVSGSLEGQVSVGGGGCSNNGHSWSLAHR